MLFAYEHIIPVLRYAMILWAFGLALACATTGCAAQAPAQQTEPTAAQRQTAARRYAAKKAAERKQLERLARRNGWALEIRQADGRTLVLTGVDERGRPLYTTTDQAQPPREFPPPVQPGPPETARPDSSRHD